jgi:3-methyl-2-oxobutanoate hydroxymethyltransferase
MPYGSYATEEIGVLNALRLMKEGSADVVKMQGGREKAPIIMAIADAGVPVMSHVGMCPHFMHFYGGFKLQGRSAEEAMRIVEAGLATEAAGACGFEIEAVPSPVAKAVDDAVQIFTFGIGAGAQLRSAAAGLRPARGVRSIQAQIHQALRGIVESRRRGVAGLRRGGAGREIPRCGACL